jgi:hypothetical protein
MEIAVYWMKRQIAVTAVTTLGWRARIAVWSVNHLAVWSSARLTHRATVRHDRARMSDLVRTLSPHHWSG